jgi:hypothetical protein
VVKLDSVIVFGADGTRGGEIPKKADLKLDVLTALDKRDPRLVHVMATLVEAPGEDASSAKLKLSVHVVAMFDGLPEGLEGPPSDALPAVWPYAKSALDRLAAVLSIATLPLPLAMEC